jgi:hypothetical protein
MNATLIVFGIVALQFGVAVLLGQCIRAGKTRSFKGSDQVAPCFQRTSPTMLASK